MIKNDELLENCDKTQENVKYKKTKKYFYKFFLTNNYYQKHKERILKEARERY